MPDDSSLIKSIRANLRKARGLPVNGQRIEQLARMRCVKIMDDKDQEQELLVDGYVSPISPEFQWRNWAKDEEGLTGDLPGRRAGPVQDAAGLARHGCPLLTLTIWIKIHNNFTFM